MIYWSMIYKTNLYFQKDGYVISHIMSEHWQIWFWKQCPGLVTTINKSRMYPSQLKGGIKNYEKQKTFSKFSRIGFDDEYG